MMFGGDSNLSGYNVYGVCAAEIELDVLTGNHIVRRVDLLEDTGLSMSPNIDVGQVCCLFLKSDFDFLMSSQHCSNKLPVIQAKQPGMP